MALQIWLPLNGNLNNQGISKNLSINNTGFTVDNNGKIGKCYLTNSKKLEFSIENLSTSSWSLAAWFYPTSSSSSGHQYIISLNTSTASDFTGTLCFYSDKICVRTGGTTYQGDSVVLNTWHHGVATYDNNLKILKLYHNGNLVMTKENPVLPVAATKCFIGVRGSATGAFVGKLNDIRIYNHCLSIREVKELAKGLILHYPLNNNGIGNLNILSDFDTSFQSYNNGATTLFTNQMNNGTQEIVSNIGGINGKCLHLHSSGGNNRQYRTKSLEQGKTYTISADYYSLNAQNTAWRGELNGGNYSWVGNNAAYTTPGEWQRLSYTYTNLTSNAIIYFFVYCAQGQDCYVKNIKIEEGESSTPWCPYFLDSDIIEYDCSGFGNNGIRNGIIKYISDTPRYRTCSNITNNSSYIKVDNLQTSGFNNSYSFSWWGKISSFSGRMFWGFSNGIRLNGVYNGNLWNTGDGSNNPLYTPGTTTQITVPSVNTWHHFVMTGDGTSCKLYLDGEYYGIAKTYKSISGTTLIINGWDTGTSYSGQINISDFRIYCTVLSADDIKALYNDAGYVDNQGNFHAYEFVE